MFVEPRIWAALVGENGLKSRLTGPDGLLSMVRVVAAVEVDDECDDELPLHAASTSAQLATAAAAATHLVWWILMSGLRGSGRVGFLANGQGCAASRPPCGQRRL